MTCLVVIVLAPGSTPGGSMQPRTCWRRGCRWPRPHRELAQRFGCSPRQAHRYAERGSRTGQASVPEQTTVFTVKLPVALVARVRAHAAASGRTLSAVVAQALEEFLARAHRKRPRR